MDEALAAGSPFSSAPPCSCRCPAAPKPRLPKTEIRGAAILDHPCGKVAVRHMGLVHAGKMDEASSSAPGRCRTVEGTPAKDRAMMSAMMKETSKSEAQFSEEIRAGGLLAVEGNGATLTVQQEHKDANGTSKRR